ncbi:recombination protein RecR [Candidatus Peribacteria bacterium RIFCSPHIGHO2_02_FULL_49_16]|nr:MAG: recombination protein RecR [Candidatus Peribacteria bacterium RIFCSPHIGHO2_01_FULL_49_38]OGJ60149.1 MAG: recombination protein RecR [Candidatus Peribacteria bacterium RIFCSPHIGHO2_02_FULL_49_16]
MSLLPQSIERVIEEFAKLPGIGPKSAERLTFHLLRGGRASPESLGKSLLHLKNNLQYCSKCQMVTVREVCQICEDSQRNHSMILVVEKPLEVVAFEKTSYDGVYHVLHGVLSPIDGMGPEQLKINELVERVKQGGIDEVIVATDPDIEGEATASFLQQKLKDHIPKITRLAHGLPMGADIEFADQITLKEALTGRRILS